MSGIWGSVLARCNMLMEESVVSEVPGGDSPVSMWFCYEGDSI